MMTIHLQELEFFAFHGLHPEEAITGNTFIVSMDIELTDDKIIDSIENTVDYEKAFLIIQKHMRKKEGLLEVLAQNISKEVSALNNNICKTSITIIKKNAPISNFQGKTGVTLSLNW